MKKVSVYGLVIAVHIVVVGVFASMQGCGRTVSPGGGIGGPSEVIMPPTTPAVIDMPMEPDVVTQQPEARTWPVEMTTYVVRRGDTLSGICSRYGLSLGEVMAVNQLTNKNLIRSGQKLILPGKVDVDAAPARVTSAPSTRPSSNRDGNYVVQKGDCLSVIASRYGSTVAAIRKANDLKSDTIFVGQKLVVQGATGDAAPESAPVVAPEPAAIDPLEPVMDSAPVVDMPIPVPAPIEAPVVVEAAEAAVETAEPVAGSDQFRVYVVGENEDLYSVGLLWNVSVDQIKALNGLTDATTLTPGQRLKIPIVE